jgi:rhodanese-related sulfurtransferase/polyisoprenoid-binding protein YceI
MEALVQTGELRKQLESTDPPIVMDVRLEDAFKAAHIPGAINNCVFEVAFGERLAKFIPDRTRSIVVYGADSESYEARVAAEKLFRAGYLNVFEYRDGLAAWQADGGPIELGEPLPAEPSISDGIHPIDLSESSIGWSGRNLLNKHHGRIGLRSGQLEFVHGELIGGRLVIDLNDIVCFDLQGTEWHDVLINHLKSDDFFDVERFPEALVVLTDARRIGVAPGQLEINASLTLKEVTASLTFLAEGGVTSEGKAAAQAVSIFDRTRWNVLYGSGRFFHRLGKHLVNDLVELEIKIVTQ